jgi:hypothetical protein
LNATIEIFTMEEFFYIILLIIWLAVSYFQKQKKAREKAAAPKPDVQQEPSTAPPKEVDMEELLEEFFGGGKKATPGAEGHSGTEEAREYTPEVMESDRQERQPGYQSWESQAQQSYNDKKESRQEETLTQGYGEFKGTEGVEDDFEFAAEGKVETIEDLIRTHAAQDAREQAIAEEKYQTERQEGVPEFDLRTAVIFSEILNKKYT